MAWLLVAQVAAILVAVVIAVIEIESIVFSGPLLSISGLLITFLSFRRDRLLGLLFGLSAPTVAAFCLFVIATLEWGPAEAHWPVAALLVLYGFFSIPAGVLAALDRPTPASERRRASSQFSIAAMLVLMFLLAVVLGFAQAAGDKGLAAGISLAYLVVLLHVLSRFFRNRRLQKLATVPSMFAPKQAPPGSPFDD